MIDVVLESHGFEIGPSFFEPFSLKKGDYVSIDFSLPADFEVENRLIKILSGVEKNNKVKVNELIIPVAAPIPKSRLSFFNNKSAVEYLNEHSILTNDVIVNLLEELDVNPTDNIYKLGITERMLLALEAAISRTRNIIISVAGLDYEGKEKVKSRLQDVIHSGALIEINYLSNRGREFLFEKAETNYNRIEVQNSQR